ncbi:MAG: hypothetical protein KGL52_16660 [Rhodospirillales bacterium]|nr:hypothetical protein [Rhodospirillales bacterium]
MKKGEQPEVSVKWWKGSQPKGLKSAGKLEDALKSYEAAKSKLEKSSDSADAAKAMEALDDIATAAKGVLAEAGKAKGNQDMDWTAEAMKKFDREIAAERKSVGDMVEEDDDGQFSDPEVYHVYLLAALKRLRTGGTMNFGVVLGKKAEDHRLAVHKSKGGKALAGMLARETGLRAMSFGVAMTPKAAGQAEEEALESEDQEGSGIGDEKSSTLILSLEGRQLPGLKKKLTKMLKKFKPLPFKGIKLMMEGKELQDLDDPEDTDHDDYDDESPANDPEAISRRLEELKLELAGLVREVQQVSNIALKGDLARLASQAGAQLRSQNISATEQALAALQTALRSGSATSSSGTSSSNGANNSLFASAETYEKFSKIWIGTRNRVEAEVEKLRSALVAAYEEDGIAGEIEKSFKSKVAPVVNALDASLADKLMAASKATDGDTRATMVADAQAILQRSRSYVDGESLLADLDDNPFVPLKIRDTMLNTLDALGKAIH